MTSNIKRDTHKFWNKIALIIGLYLVIDGFLSIMIAPTDTLISELPRIIRILIGTGMIIVDTWFLMNV